MPRLSIDITPEEHQKLKAISALSGKSIKKYILDKALYADNAHHNDIKALEDFLAPRIESAQKGDFSSEKSAKDIFSQQIGGKNH